MLGSVQRNLGLQIYLHCQLSSFELNIQTLKMLFLNLQNKDIICFLSSGKVLQGYKVKITLGPPIEKRPKQTQLLEVSGIYCKRGASQL